MTVSPALTLPRIGKSALSTAALGVAVTGAVAVTAFLLQVVALPRPKHGQLVAVQVERWLVRHRVIDSTAFRAGARITSTCIGSWFGPVPPFRHRVRASLLVTSGHQRLVAERGEVFRGGVRLRDDETAQAVNAIELAGCPWWLSRRLGDVLQRRGPLVVSTVTSGRAYRLRLGHGTNALELLVNRATFQPIAIDLGGRPGGRARLRPGSQAGLLRVARSFAAPLRSRREPQ